MIGQKKTKIFWHQSEARITPTVWNWSVKTLSPGALILVLDFSLPEFFPRLFRLSLPPLTAPGSPRMIFSVITLKNNSSVISVTVHIYNSYVRIAWTVETCFLNAWVSLTIAWVVEKRFLNICVESIQARVCCIRLICYSSDRVGDGNAFPKYLFRLKC